MSTRTVADVLDEAADVIREEGWHQGYFNASGSGRVCAIGGMSVACGFYAYDWEHDDIRAAMAVLAAHLGLHCDPDEYRENEGLVTAIGKWNDADDRTVEQVLAALEGAARAERERAS